MILRIIEGYCYQINNNLLDVTTPSTARMLMKLICLPKDGGPYA